MPREMTGHVYVNRVISIMSDELADRLDLDLGVDPEDAGPAIDEAVELMRPGILKVLEAYEIKPDDKVAIR